MVEREVREFAQRAEPDLSSVIARERLNPGRQITGEGDGDDTVTGVAPRISERANLTQADTRNASLLGRLAHGGILGRLIRLDVSARQGPPASKRFNPPFDEQDLWPRRANTEQDDIGRESWARVIVLVRDARATPEGHWPRRRLVGVVTITSGPDLGRGVGHAGFRVPSRSGGQRAQAGNSIGGIAGPVDRRAGHEDVSACLGASADRLI